MPDYSNCNTNILFHELHLLLKSQYLLGTIQVTFLVGLSHIGPQLFFSLIEFVFLLLQLLYLFH